MNYIPYVFENEVTTQMNPKSDTTTHKTPTLGLSMAVVGLMAVIMFFGVMMAKSVSIPACLITIITLICVISKYALGYSFKELMDMMAESIKNGTFGLWFFVAIGGIIASWMMAGTVPAIIYYGLELINPAVFLPAGLILCSITAFCTGTSWGTVGTVGIALVGIGQGMGIPLPITAAMIVSGAAFGDKMSPVSDTPNLTSMACGADLYDSIRAMITTITPAYVLAFILFCIVGVQYGTGAMNYAIIEETRSVLAQHFNLHPIVLLPIIVLLVLSVKRFPSLPSMAIAIVTGFIVAVIFQGASIAACLESLNSGFVIQTGSPYVDPILNRGGLQKMMSTFSIAFLAISMGGILDKCGYLTVIVTSLLKRVATVGSLSLVVIVSSVLSTAALSEAYLSFILNGTVYKKEFDKRGLNRAMLARQVTEGGLMPAPLMPWTTFGAFCMASLGVSGLAFAPYAFLNYLSPLVSIVMAYLGLGVVWNNKANQGKRRFTETE